MIVRLHGVMFKKTRRKAIIIHVSLFLFANAQDIQQRMFIPDRFNGKIEVVNENTIKYDDEVLMIYTSDKINRKIFKKGIFYPSLITGIVKKGKERTEELKSMLLRNDSLKIVNF